ncbi:MAG: hypothetical protein ABI045_05340 [Flavobacteriales bacterium]
MLVFYNQYRLLEEDVYLVIVLCRDSMGCVNTSYGAEFAYLIGFLNWAAETRRIKS